MNSEIRFRGFSAAPSDYDCLDGELATSLGMINEDGSLRNIRKPKVVVDFTDYFPIGSFSKVDVVLVHKPEGHQNLVLLSERKNGQKEIYYWSDTEKVPYPSTPVYIIKEGETLLSVEAIGNTLAITTSNGISFARVADGKCTFIGQVPEIPNISFGLDIATEKGTKFDYHYYDWTAEWTDDAKTLENQRSAELNRLTGEANKMLNQKMSDSFCYPFYVRFAYRMYDGTLTKHSAPILMIPSITNPIMQCTEVKDEGKRMLYRGHILTAFAKMVMKINSIGEQGSDELAKWQDIIKSVDIFISAPIYTYNQAAKPNEFVAKISESTEGLGVAFGKMDITPNYGRIPFNTIWKGYFDASEKLMLLPSKENVMESVGKCTNFYKFVSIPIDKLNGRDWQTLKSDISDLKLITQQEVMTDDFVSHNAISGTSTFVYNNRLNVGNVSKTLFNGFRTQTALTFTEQNAPTTRGVLKIWVRKYGKQYVVGREEIFVPKNINECIPYYFYPDSDAYQVEIEVRGQSKSVKFPLIEHPFLNGAYYYDSLKPIVSGEKTSAAFSTDNKYVTTNEIYTSEVNNPFVFLAKYVTSVGNGDIIGLSTATKALSQGQYGQHPLYTFTTDGVWAIHVADDGTYSAVQPVTRDVCTNENSITQIDNAVLFATQRGIMMLSGSDSVCITDIINSDTFQAYDIPHLEEITNLAGYDFDNSVDMGTFSAYLNNSQLMYDYLHQRIYLYNSDFTYAYVFNLKDKTWGLVEHNLRSNPKTYPNAIAVTKDNKLLNYSQDAEIMKGLLLTRPLKLDAANILKTMNTAILRGHFAKGHIKTALWGSRDLIHWFYITSSVDHYLRGFSGTPYKYFRIGVVSEMTRDETLSSMSIDFSIKDNNKLR